MGISQSCARKDPVLSGLKAVYSTEERGKLNSFNYRMYLRNEQGPVSPIHDVPLVVDLDSSEVHMIVEVPRWSNAKMEVNTREPLNPIMQDSVRGRMRYLSNIFPYHGVPFNYGALPQTWENPHQVDSITGCLGDNDPIDAIEIGDRLAKRGDVLKVKVLGALALIDQGESDWKIITVDVRDPLAPSMHDISDVEQLRPGLLQVAVDWLRIYKVPDGKPENNFAFDGKAKGRMLAMRIVQDNHRTWQETIKKRSRTGGLVLTNTTVRGSPYRISFREAEEIISRHAQRVAPRPVPTYVDNWFFLGNSSRTDLFIAQPSRSSSDSPRSSKSLPESNAD